MRDYTTISAEEFTTESIQMKMRWLARRLRYTDKAEEIQQWVKVVASLKDSLKELIADMAGKSNPRCASTKMTRNYTISAPTTVEYAIREIATHCRPNKGTNELMRCRKLEMEDNVLENEVALRNPQEVEVLDKEVGWENTQDIDVPDKEDIYALYKEVFLENTQEEVILENTQEERVLENPQPLPPRVEVNEITNERKNEAEAKGVETELKNKWWKRTKKRLLEQHAAGSLRT